LIGQEKNFLIALRTSVHWDTVAGDLVSRQAKSAAKRKLADVEPPAPP
jgi:hypothetical protein